MNRVEGCSKIIYFYLQQIEKNIHNIEKYYASFFIVDDIFVNDGSGKTKLNKYLFGKQNNLVTNEVIMINNMIDEALETIKKTINDVLSVHNSFEEEHLKTLFLNDVKFLKDIEDIFLSESLPKNKKENDIKVIKKLISFKNRLHNYRYYVQMFETKSLNQFINNLSLEDSINNVILFEIIDSFGLQLEELKKILKEFNDIKIEQRKINDFDFLVPSLELHKRQVQSFEYKEGKYKVFLTYNMDFKFKKKLMINIPYLENIVYTLINQSCIDLIKREYQGVKFHKSIDVSVKKVGRKIHLIVRNNGFERKHIDSLFEYEEDNKYIIETANLANDMGIELKIKTTNQEGMEYTLIL